MTDTDNGEQCDAGGVATETCRSDCRLQRYCILEFDLTGTYQITDSSADGSHPQSGGVARVRLPDDGSGAPGSHASSLNRAGVLYYSMPTEFTATAFSTTVTTEVLTTAGTPSNACPLATGTLSGSNLVADACPYGPNHCTADWTPDDQNPPSITAGAGCLQVTATGTIYCSGMYCGFIGLDAENEVDDTWYQPQNTVQYSSSFMSSLVNGLGGTLECGAGDKSHPDNANYTNKIEAPNRASSRGWVSTSGTRASLTCNLLPAACP